MQEINTREELFRADSKQLVDMLFDNKFFKDGLTRDDMQSVEDLIEFILTTRFNSLEKIKELNRKIENRITGKK